MKYLHLLWRNLLRRKIRTTFTFLSIVVAFLLFGLLMAIASGFEAGVTIAGQNRLLTIHKVSLIQLLPVRYLAAIKSTPGVRDATHFTWLGGSNYTDNPVVTVERQVGAAWVPFADMSGRFP